MTDKILSTIACSEISGKTNKVLGVLVINASFEVMLHYFNVSYQFYDRS